MSQIRVIWCEKDILSNVEGSGDGVVVKILACGARGTGSESGSRYYDFKNWVSSYKSLFD